MTPSEILRRTSIDDWQAITAHPFCMELAAGTLPRQKMAGYLVQDYQFIDGFVRLAASAIAHAPTLADSVPLAQFLAVITGPENTYFLRSFEALGVAPDRYLNPPLARPTTAFQTLMADVATSGSYARMIAVLTVAEWSYLAWASPHNPPGPDLPFHFAEWITLHAGQDFEGVVTYLRTQLDQAWTRADDAGRAVIAADFSKAVTLERDFFDAAYQGM